MMNIFIMILVAVFMAGFYMLSAPSQRVIQQESTYAMERADLRSIAECAAAAHNATIRGGEFNDICITQNNIESKFICLNTNLTVTKCEIVRKKKPAYSFIVTAAAPVPDDKYNDMMEILEQHFADAGTFGIYQNKLIVSGGTATKRAVPKGIIEEMELTDGQLVYMTQYEIPDADTQYTAPQTADVICPAGTVKAYRFGRWQCIGYNTKTNCAGDMIWDSDLLECVADESRRPLCASQQTAVLVDDVWECINPFPDKQCPSDMVARLNYNTLEWECVADPNKTESVKKCAHMTAGAVYGKPGATLRVPQTSSCTDCEQMITDPDTCVSVCVPDPAKITEPGCYPGRTDECSGPSRGFYFGFPSQKYAANVDAVSHKSVPIDAMHDQNRKFNCLDCGNGVIDADKSLPPYIAICK